MEDLEPIGAKEGAVLLKVAAKLVLLLIGVWSLVLIVGVVPTNARIEINDEVERGSRIKGNGQNEVRHAQIKIKEEVKKGSRDEAEESEQEKESEGVLVKEIQFVLPYRPPESQELIALRSRQRQVMSMVDTERNRLKTSSGWMQDDIKAHIAWLEKNLTSINENLDKVSRTEGPLIPIETLKELTGEFTNKHLTIEDMNSVAEAVTLAYQEKGYILARAYIEEQEIKDGILKVSISEGDIGDVKVSGQKYYKDRVIKRNFAPQARHGVIREDLLERGLLLTQDLQSTETRVLLKRGEKPGTADLELETKDNYAFSWNVDYNNFGSEFVGEDRFGTHVGITEPFWGSTFSFRGVTGTDRDKSGLASFDLAVPVNSYGTKVSASYLKGLYAVGQDLADLGLTGTTHIRGTRLTHPILRKRDQNLNLAVGYDYKHLQNFELNEIRSIDKLDVFYASFDFDNLDRFLGKNLASFTYSHGHRNENENDPLHNVRAIPSFKANDTSLTGNDKNYDRLNMSLARIQKIYGFYNIFVRASGQFTEDRVPPIEEFVIGGYGTVRGHTTSLFLGDAGYTLSAELLAAPPLIADKTFLGQRVAQLVQLAIFFDHGYVSIPDTAPGEEESESLSGYGAGIRLYYKDRMQFKFDVAWPTKDKDTISGGEDNIFYYFLFNLNFLN